MVKTSRPHQGYTLTELMIVMAILGVLSAIGPTFYKQIRQFFILNNVRTEIQRDARSMMSVMTRRIREAQSQTLVIDQAAGQPPYSRISFITETGDYIRYYQQGKSMFLVDQGSHTMTDDLRYLAFALPRSDDLGIVSVSFTLEKTIYEGKTKALHMASERVRVMN